MKMCSSSASSFMWYNPPVVNKRCGEVFCSQTFDDFSINCATCSQEFNLLSFNLFIKHVKICLPATISELENPDNSKHEVPNYPVKCDAAKNNDDVPTTENDSDPLMLLQVEKTEVEDFSAKAETMEDVENLSDYRDEDEIIDNVARRKKIEEIFFEALWGINQKESTAPEATDNQYDRQMKQTENFKLQTSPAEKEQRNVDIKIEPAQNDDSDQYSNDEEEEERLEQELRKTIGEPTQKISCEPKIISDIIAQYKEHVFLWDQTAPLYNNKRARLNALRKITNFINNKFNKKLTEKDVGQQIKNLRRAYRRVELQKNRGDYLVSLWYFDELSFISKKSDTINICPIPNNTTVLGKEHKVKVKNPFEDQTLNPSECSEASGRNSQEEKDGDASNEAASDYLSLPIESDKKLILRLIKEYERHPCLWNSKLHETSSRSQLNNAYKEITNAINVKCKTKFTDAMIKKKILQLRSSYKRVLRIKEAFEKKQTNTKKKFKPRLWYFDKITFLNATESEKTSENEEDEYAIEHEDDDNSNMDADFVPEDSSEASEQEPSAEENDSQSAEKPTNKNRALITTLIEEYKKQPVLWAVKHYTNKDCARRTAYKHIAEVINEKFNTNYTPKSISNEVNKLRCSYNRLLRQKKLKRDGKLKIKLWYADLLSFIDRKPKTVQQDNQDSNISLYDDRPRYSAFKQNNSSGDEEPDEKKQKLNKGEHVFQIIELLKAAPVLWDTRHKQYNQRAVRNKAIENIISILRREHNYHLTNAEFRYQMRFLRDSYFRALRQETASKEGNIKFVAKPFFFDQMSFLKPLAESSLTSCKVEESCEDYTFLTKNKQLMEDFIELYKTQSCLWDPEHKDRNNQSACSKAYTEIGNLFSSNNVILSKEQVTSAVSFLHITVENTQKTVNVSNPSETSEAPVWFYEHLRFLNELPPVKDIYCNHCDQYFRKISDYEKHTFEFVGDRPYKCFICNEEFASRYIYAYHQMTHKTAHKCELCGFQAFDNYNFDIHMRRHKGIFSFKCEHCNKGFVTSNEFNRHSRLHSNERAFICHICGKSLATNSDLEEHMKRHLNQRDYKCEICGSAFYTTKALKGHMASHSSERPHVCEVCGGAFKRKKTLAQHKELHAEHKKYECNICGKFFAQKTGLKYHMKLHGCMFGS